MGLFERKRSTFDSVAPLYTIGDSQTLLVIGLGNIGKDYVGNRHNVGFMVLNKYQTSHDFSGWVTKKDLACEISIGQVGSTRVILAKPTTLMNNSGEAAQKLQSFYHAYSPDTVVVHDELDIDFGTIRTRVGGGSAGHNGIKSLLTHIDEDFARIRIGIGPKQPPQINSADFVLQDFDVKEQKILTKIINESCTILDERTTGQLDERTITIT